MEIWILAILFLVFLVVLIQIRAATQHYALSKRVSFIEEVLDGDANIS